jgi:hypothetical protein
VLPICSRAFAASLVVLAGCAADVPLGRPTLTEQDVLGRAATIREHPTTRSGVHSVLGEPIVASDPRGVEVFRLDGQQRKMLLIFAPYPVPMPGPTEKFAGYVLVSYDEGGHVAAIDSGFASSPGFGATSSIILRAGDYEFMHAADDTLSVSLDRFLRDRAAAQPATACTVLVACEPACTNHAPAVKRCGVCWTRVEVDAAPQRDLPVLQVAMYAMGTAKEAPAGGTPAPDPAAACAAIDGTPDGSTCMIVRHSFVPLGLAAGRHALRYTARQLAGEVNAELTCQPGELLFATLGGEIVESYSLGKQFGAGLKTGAATGSVTFGGAAPASVCDQRVVLNQNGQWLP